MQKNHPKLLRQVRQAGQSTKVRFVLVGISNTLIDVVCFNILMSLFGAGMILASIISTTVAMVASYLLNKQAVFRNRTPHSLGQITLFLIVTLTGIWLIQTLIMVQVFHFLEHSLSATGHPLLVWFLQNAAKGVGIVAGALWNYFGYSRLVFRESTNKKLRQA
jgi:putative flippase GtrA